MEDKELEPHVGNIVMDIKNWSCLTIIKDDVNGEQSIIHFDQVNFDDADYRKKYNAKDEVFIQILKDIENTMSIKKSALTGGDPMLKDLKEEYKSIVLRESCIQGMFPDYTNQDIINATIFTEYDDNNSINVIEELLTRMDRFLDYSNLHDIQVLMIRIKKITELSQESQELSQDLSQDLSQESQELSQKAQELSQNKTTEYNDLYNDIIITWKNVTGDIDGDIIITWKNVTGDIHGDVIEYMYANIENIKSLLTINLDYNNFLMFYNDELPAAEAASSLPPQLPSSLQPQLPSSLQPLPQPPSPPPAAPSPPPAAPAAPPSQQLSSSLQPSPPPSQQLSSSLQPSPPPPPHPVAGGNVMNKNTTYKQFMYRKPQNDIEKLLKIRFIQKLINKSIK